MNPDTNRFEPLYEPTEQQKELLKKLTTQCKNKEFHVQKLLRPDGSLVPEHWSIFKIGEEIVIKNYTFKIGYIGESTLLLEPVGIVEIGKDK